MADAGAIALLREDPDLGQGIPPEEWEDALRLVVVPGYRADVGPVELGDAHEPSLGVLVLDGLVTHNVVIGDRVASYLVGPGDVIHLTTVRDALLPATSTHHVSEPARLAVLDRRFIAATRRWPALLITMHKRLCDHDHRLAVHAAIGKLRRIEDRVLALLWHLAERWGRVTGEGVVVPLALTHETLGRLCGAERPTVSLALTDLGQRGDVHRRPDGAFVLRDGSQALLTPDSGNERPQIRPLAVKRTLDAKRGAPEPQDDEQLEQRIAALREDLEDRASRVQERTHPER